MLKKYVYLTMLLAFTAPSFCAKNNLYELIKPQILAKIDLSKPTTQEQDLVTATAAFSQHLALHDENFPMENFVSQCSVNFVSDVLNQYLKPHTFSGRIQTAYIATQMITDITELQKRQGFIAYLHKNPQTLCLLHELLQKTQMGERCILSLYRFSAAENTRYAYNIKRRTQYCVKSLNTERILGASTRLKHIMVPLCTSLKMQMMASGAHMKYREINNQETQFQQQPFSQFCRELLMVDTLKMILSNPLTLSAYLATIGLVVHLDGEIREDFDIIYNFQKDLINLSKTMQAISKICQILTENPELRAPVQKDFSKLLELFNPESTVTSSDLKYVIQQLATTSFQGEPTYYFSHQGKILATHYRLSQCQDELISYLAALGNIDAFTSAAQLYVDFADHDNTTFCLPTFIESFRPSLDIQGYWHPLITNRAVVTNDLNLACGTAQNTIITGPNAGGKTTSLMALIINIIFAQTFGIAPSNQMTLTPFTKIHCYLDITTNLSEGLSLFAAEVDRAKKLKSSILSCTPEQKTFTIIDEIFSGTNPTVAVDVGMKFIKQLADMPHSMAIITTHFPQLTDIATTHDTFTNYKVDDATIMDDGSIVYPFKLVPGISTQNIAQQMLLQQGVI